jgi:multiple sugar transport system substrate-binding protein
VAAGLLANLDEFTSDPNLTPAEWNPKDFVEGAQVPYCDAKGATYGYSWEGGAMVMGLSRMDLMEKKGLKIPRTFAELQQVCAGINGTDNVNGFVSFQLHHWCLPPYIQGFGGNVFRNPPADVMPTLNSPQAVEAVEFYANLLKNYAPRGVITYTEDQARQSLLTGRSNILIHSSSWITPTLMSDESKVKDTARIVRMPAGPVHDYPASNSQGLGIPKNAKNKKAAWEFIKWALSPEISMRLVKEHGHSSICRRSVIESEAYRRLNTVNGQDLGALYLEVLELPAKGENYMAYRTVKEFPIVGDVINKAVEQVVTGQLSGRDAMNAAQEQAVANLRRAGTPL